MLAVAKKRKKTDAPPLKRRKMRILNGKNFDPTKQIPLGDVIHRIISLAQIMAEKRFYRYQVEIAYRLVESVLVHDGQTISALLSRQSGKSEVLANTLGALAVILPPLARKHPDSWHLNLTDDHGVDRGYATGIKIGIYAPRKDQSKIIYDRIRKAFLTDSTKKVLSELGIRLTESNGNRVITNYGSRILCESASEQSKIEGETHHLVVAEEAQDISDMKIRKSIMPMVSSLMGTVCMIGTASTKKCAFYEAIRINQQVQLATGLRNHFFFPYTVCQNYNSLYKGFIGQEKIRLGEHSDEFRLSYAGEWIFERGMFITPEMLFDSEVSMHTGLFSELYTPPLPPQLGKNYSIVAGIDWGACDDSTVVTLVAVDWNNPVNALEYSGANGHHTTDTYRKHVIGFLEFQGDNYEYQYTQIMDYLSSMPALSKIVMDSTACGLPLFHRMQTEVALYDVEVEGVTFTLKSKSECFKNLHADFCAKRLTIPLGKEARRTTEHVKFVKQMTDLQKDYKGTYMAVAHPEEKGAHDDYPDSLCLAVWGGSTPAVSRVPSFSDENPFT